MIFVLRIIFKLKTKQRSRKNVILPEIVHSSGILSIDMKTKLNLRHVNVM